MRRIALIAALLVAVLVVGGWMIAQWRADSACDDWKEGVELTADKIQAGGYHSSDLQEQESFRRAAELPRSRIEAALRYTMDDERPDGCY